MDEATAYYTEWSKSKREKQSSYTNAYIWNLERWHWWTYLQSSSGDRDIKNRLMDTARWGEGEGRRYGESNMETYIIICKIDSQWAFAVWLRELKSGFSNNLEGWDRERGGREIQVGWDMGISGRFMSMFGRNQCNTVKQLSFN